MLLGKDGLKNVDLCGPRDKVEPNNEASDGMSAQEDMQMLNRDNQVHWRKNALSIAMAIPTSTTLAMRTLERGSPALTSGTHSAARACILGRANANGCGKEAVVTIKGYTEELEERGTVNFGVNNALGTKDPYTPWDRAVLEIGILCMLRDKVELNDGMIGEVTNLETEQEVNGDVSENKEESVLHGAMVTQTSAGSATMKGGRGSPALTSGSLRPVTCA